MSGLQKICKRYGGIKIYQCGEAVKWVWDYANEKAVKESEMPLGSDRWLKSERARWKTYIKSMEEKEPQ